MAKSKKSKPKSRAKAKVKDSTCRAYGSWMSGKDEKRRSTGAAKLASKTCKSSESIKKGTAKIGAIAKTAKKIRKPGESWPAAMKRAAKQA